jgi:hypothetical protein
MRALLLVAEHDDPAMFARIDVIRALNSHFERVFDPSRKDTRWGPRRLGIDDGSRYGGTLAGPLLICLPRFRRRTHVNCGPQHLLLISLAILDKQFHRSRKPVLIFPEYIGGRRGITNMFGRFKRRLRALMTPGKPTVGKFLQAFERGFLVLPELDAYRRVGLQSSRRLQDVWK